MADVQEFVSYLPSLASGDGAWEAWLRAYLAVPADDNAYVQLVRQEVLPLQGRWAGTAQRHEIRSIIRDSMIWESPELAALLEKSEPLLEAYGGVSHLSYFRHVPKAPRNAEDVILLRHFSDAQRIADIALLTVLMKEAPGNRRLAAYQLAGQIAEQISRNRNLVELTFAERLRNRSFQALLAAAEAGLIDLADLRHAMETQFDVDDTDVRLRTKDALLAELAVQMFRLSRITASGWSGLHFDMDAVEETLEIVQPSPLAPGELPGIEDADPDRVREAQIDLFQFLNQRLNRQWVQDTDAMIAEAQDKSLEDAGCAMGKMLNPWEWEDLIWQAYEAEAQGLGRRVFACLLDQHFEKAVLDVVQVELMELCQQGTDPTGTGRMLLLTREDGRVILYSRGRNTVDDGGDADKDLILWSVPQTLLEQARGQ